LPFDKTIGNIMSECGASEIPIGGGSSSSGGGGGGSGGNVFGDSQITGIAYGAGKFVAVGHDGKIAYSNANGTSWTAVSNTTFGDSRIYDIAYGNNRFVAVGGYSSGNNSKIAYSADGISWTAASANGSFNCIAWGGGKFVAGGYERLGYSEDGISWIVNEYGGYFQFGNSDVSGIAYGDGKFVAVGGGGGKMTYSEDGINWTMVSSTSFGGAFIDAIAYGNGRFVAAASGGGFANPGQMAHSTDGINWTAIPAGTDNGTTSTFANSINSTISSIVWSGDKFVAVGKNGLSNVQPWLAYSANGTSWTGISPAEAFGQYGAVRAIAYGGGRFVAGGEYSTGSASNGTSRIAYSDDGINWTAAP
jgi:hypothetical protein